jgi:hypothetical protein
MSKRRRLWGIGVTVFMACLLPAALYRCPRGGPVVFQANVAYQIIDIGQGDFERSVFEEWCGNRRLFLVDAPWVYVRKADFKRCWAERVDMGEKGDAIRVTVKASPLLFGGYGPAQVVLAERVHEPLVGGK